MNYKLSLINATLVILALIGCTTPSSQTPLPAPQSAAGDTNVSIEQSPNDDRAYRYITLSNKLRVLLVSDPQTDKAAASLVAFRGSHHEPSNRLGLAHFLEHMLFIGTKKYPEVDAYQTFVGAHGGSSNAYTAADHTNYFFDIQPDYFREGMDRFAQFFIGPLFEAAYVDREKNAVNSEYQLQQKDDGWRAFATEKLIYNADHPGSRFNIGSLETLGEGVREDLLTFFAENYSADQMALVALTNEDLDTLEAWVRPMFGEIENRNIGPAPINAPMFKKGQLPSTIELQTLKDRHTLSFNFPVPATEPHYQKKPLLYISNLLGHEGAGSLHQALKSRGWIESLSAGSSRFDDNTTVLAVDLQLTTGGTQHVDEISGLLFDYIVLLKSAPVDQWRYDEQAKVTELSFRFLEKSSPTGFVYQTGPQLAHYPPEHILSWPYLMDHFDPKLIENYLGYLREDNVYLTRTRPDFEVSDTTKMEPWFKVPYAITPGKLPRKKLADVALTLPAENEFMSSNPRLRDITVASPQLVTDKPGLELWLAGDLEFGAPRANLRFNLGIPGGFVTPEDIVSAQLYARLVADDLNEYAYPAFLAGLGYQISAQDKGFQVSLVGYDEKQPILMERVLQAFTSLAIDPERFAVYQQELDKRWRNFTKEKPYNQTYATLNHLLVPSSWPPGVLAETLSGMTPEKLRQWQKTTLDEIKVEGLLHGNVDSAVIATYADLLNHHLALQEFDFVDSEVKSIAKAHRLAMDIDHPDASMVLYVQDADTSYPERAKSALAVALLKQAYFTELRTNQQLGYVVAVANKTLIQRAGIAFIVQSPVADPASLEATTQTFLKNHAKTVRNMSAEEFGQYKDGVISQLTERDKNLNERTQRLWSDLNDKVVTFDSGKRIATEIRTITQDQAVAYLSELPDRLTAQQLLVYNTGKFETAPETGELIENIASFKNATGD